MAEHSGMAPQAHAHLLPRALRPNSQQDDDGQDQIGSTTSTPSGIATPQLDPTDKRLPGIMHSFFAQVRACSDSTPSRPNNQRSPTPSFVSVGHPHSEGEAEVPSGDSSLSGSIVFLERGQDLPGSAPSAQPEQRYDLFDNEKSLEPADPKALPTPPPSSSCSFLHKEPEEAENGGSGVGSVYRALKGLILPKDSSSKSPKRPTSSPISSVSNDAVLASHFSNPSLISPAPQNLSACPESSKSISKSSEELAKLTETAAAADSRPKNTPPLTPRAMSNETQHTEKKSAHSLGSSPPRSHPDAPPRSDPPRSNGHEEPNESPETTRVATVPDGQGPAVTPLKGKLTVNITEGRGLRPSYDPYVVCVFEWNEYISKGAQSDGANDTGSAKKGSRVDALGSVPIQRSNSDSGRPMAIPMKSRQSSHNSSMDGNDRQKPSQVTDPQWNHDAVFDVLGDESDIDISVYDRSSQEAFLGHIKMSLNLKEDQKEIEGWFPLESRGRGDGAISGEVHLQMTFQKTDQAQVGPNDFQILKLIGRGTFGQVYQVKKKDTQRIYAMKVLSKKVIIQKKEIAHTLGERNILVRTAMADSPFIVGLKFSFQTPTDLYLVTDYMSGGELFWHLQKEGRFAEDRAKFYIAELILALQHLHQHDIVYRDLKPENILLDANGHIALCDFGLSKANLTKHDTTNTFCGTTEYLAPEVLLDEQGYTKMVDFWSLGVLVFEMCCGWSPFYAEETQQMYKNIAFGKVRFPRDALSAEGRSFVKGLLNRNPKHRLGAKGDAKELMAHPFFNDVDWDALNQKNVIPPFKPKLKSVADTSYFDPEFTTALDNSTSLNARASALAGTTMAASTPLSPGMQANFKGFTFVNESSMDKHMKDTHHDRMDEDTREDDAWEQPPKSAASDHRMSGVVKTGPSGGDHEGEIFGGDDHFDM